MLGTNGYRVATLVILRKFAESLFPCNVRKKPSKPTKCSAKKLKSPFDMCHYLFAPTTSSLEKDNSYKWLPYVLLFIVAIINFIISKVIINYYSVFFIKCKCILKQLISNIRISCMLLKQYNERNQFKNI